MATLSLPGLTTGIDTGALIRQLVAAESTRANTLRQRKSVWEQKSTAYGEVDTHLQALQDAVGELRSAGSLRAYNPTSSDESVLTVSAGSSASEGFHEIIINRLASAEREVHAGLATEDTLVGVGTFSYTYDTGDDAVTRTVQTTAETTLTDLRDLINNDAGNPGVTASILEYDAGGGQVHHLVLSGADTGSDHVIAVDDANTTLDGTNGTVDFTTATFTETQAAQDSQVRVDGYPSADWIERSGNTIDDVLPGVTLQLQSTGTGHVSLTREVDGLKEKLTAMVDAYNEAVEFIQGQTAYDASSETAGALIGEYTLTHVRSALRTVFIESLPGFQDGSDSFTLAGQIGLSIDEEGLLELDESVLDDAISEDYLGVLAALGAQQTGTSGDDYIKFFGATADTTPSTYDVKATFDAGGGAHRRPDQARQ